MIRPELDEEDRAARQRVELLLKQLMLPPDSEFARMLRKAMRAKIHIPIGAYFEALARHAEAEALAYRLALSAVKNGNYDVLVQRWRDFFA